MSIERADATFGPMLAACGFFATMIGGALANVLRKRTPAGYVWVMAMSLVLACAGLRFLRC